MPDFEIGHRETQTKIPEPLASTGAWNPGNWALPATTLSIASIVVFAVVFFSLVVGQRMRSLFELPSPVIWAFAALSVAVAVLVGCRQRPGHHLPRIWALALMAVTSLLTLLSLLGGTDLRSHPVLHAGLLAALAAGLALSPRLVKLRPQSPMIQSIAGWSLLLTLLFILPSACYVGQGAVALRERKIRETLEALEQLTLQVRKVTGYEWSHLGDRSRAARVEIDKLTALSVPESIRDTHLWHAAAVLDWDDDLEDKLRELTEAVVDGLDPDQTPKLSTLESPAIWWDAEERRWQNNALFPELSETTGLYYKNLGRLFQEVELNGSGPAEHTSFYRNEKGRMQSFLNETLTTLTDNWVVAKAGNTNVTPFPLLPLADILKRSLGTTDTPAPGDLVTLLQLPLNKARNLAERIRGCYPRDYERDDYHYFRIDCYAYRPDNESSGARLRLDMRVVYKSSFRQTISSWARPVEVFFLFPIPENTNHDAYRDAVMNDVFTAVKAHTTNAPRPDGGDGAVSGGFSIYEGDSRIRVYKPTIQSYYGDSSALQVRAELVSG